MGGTPCYKQETAVLSPGSHLALARAGLTPALSSMETVLSPERFLQGKCWWDPLSESLCCLSWSWSVRAGSLPWSAFVRPCSPPVAVKHDPVEGFQGGVQLCCVSPTSPSHWPVVPQQMGLQVTRSPNPLCRCHLPPGGWVARLSLVMLPHFLQGMVRLLLCHTGPARYGAVFFTTGPELLR